MKKILLAALIFAAGLAIYLAIRPNGELPPVLPPKELPKATQSSLKNDLGLEIPEGFSIDIFAKGLGSPRDLVFDDKGNLLASITASGKVVAISPKDESGKASKVTDILTSAKRPHGLAFYGGKLYVAQETQVTRYNWDNQSLLASLDKVLFQLPEGGRHFTRSIAFKGDGTMFVSIGSTCDTCYEKNEFLASVIVSDKDGAAPRLFAKGLRNTVFITVNDNSQKLWATEMGRDFLGDNLPPDEINIIEEGKDYGWPRCFGNKIADLKFDPNLTKDACQDTQPPLYEFCAHCAPLGLAFINSLQFPKDWQGDLLVAYHGSWNSSKPVGYKVARLKLSGEKVQGQEDFITGFLKNNQTIGRPVDLAFGPDGSLYISDDKRGIIFRVWQNSQN